MQTQRKATKAIQVRRDARRRSEPPLTPEQMEKLKTAFVYAALLTPQETAFRLGVTTGTLNVWRCTKRYEAAGLIATYSGGKPMYRVEDVLKFEASGRGRRAKKGKAA